jgi:predicted Zn-dependent peptidase
VLGNGLRLVVAPEPGSGVVAIAVHYGVGYRAEPPDRAGFAHLFEHLMFSGSANVPRLAHYRYVQASGGSCNAVTARDHTCYYQVLPSGALERGLFLEADRMRAPLFSAAALANQVAVIREEIGANVHGRPYGGLPWLLLPPVLFNGFANAHYAYGTVAELSEATVSDCEDFFCRYYTPGNSVLTVAGDASPALVRQLAERYFGTIGSRPAPPLPDLAEAGGYTGREQVHLDPLAPLPATLAGWRLPATAAGAGSQATAAAGADRAAANRMAYAALAAVLAGGDNARLHRALVATGAAAHVRAAASLAGEPLTSRDPDVFVLTIMHGGAPVRGAAAPLALLDDALAGLAGSGPDPAELTRAVSRLAASWYRSLARPRARAQMLGAYEIVRGRAELAWELAELAGSVSSADVAAAAAGLLASQRGVLRVQPGSAP